jgi:hypothetical protein
MTYDNLAGIYKPGALVLSLDSLPQLSLALNMPFTGSDIIKVCVHLSARPSLDSFFQHVRPGGLAHYSTESHLWPLMIIKVYPWMEQRDAHNFSS